MGAVSPFSFPLLSVSRSTTTLRAQPPLAVVASSEDGAATKLLTFVGKGGSGKTTAAIFAAQVPFLIFNYNYTYLIGVVRLETHAEPVGRNGRTKFDPKNVTIL